MGTLSTFAANQLLNHTMRDEPYTPPAAVYLAWFTTPPGADGSGSEITGGGYGREAVTFAAAVDGNATTDAPVTFSPLHSSSDVMVAGWAIFDAATSGNMVAYGHVPATVIPAGQPLALAAGAITVSSNDAHMSDLLANAWLDHLLRADPYSAPASVHVGLFTTTPTATTAGTEVAGGGYARQSPTWSVASSATTTLVDETEWAPLHTDDAQTLEGLAVLDAASSGNVLWFASWPDAIEVAALDTFTLNAAAVGWRAL